MAMVALDKDTIKSRVRLTIDEAALNESESILEADDMQLDSIIEDKAEEALRYVYSVADASLMPWSMLEGIGAKEVYPFDGVIFGSINIIDEGYAGSSPIKILFSQRDHCFVASPDTGTPFVLNEYYKSWPNEGEMYSTPVDDCLYVYKDSDDVKHKYHYVEATGTLDGDNTGWQTVETSVSSVPPYNVFELGFGFGEVWRWNYVRLASWKQTISPSEAIDVNSPAFATLLDKFSTGTWERPKVAVDYQDDGTIFLLFTMKGNLDQVSLSYVSRPAWRTEQETVGNDTVDVDYLDVGDKLEDAFIYYLSGLVCQVLGDERQQGLFQQATELMGKTLKNN